jgi:Ca2+-binding EF-hand superfamily protein|tara:strand:- start:173 stop:391 length:219 start_codon:yes stop_codon:yes gene_type:complete
MNADQLLNVKNLFSSYDINHDGYLSKGEFVIFAREALEIIGRGSANELFGLSDLNRDQKISLDEFIEMVVNI